MRFDLRDPCKSCPWRSDIPAYLRPGRVTEIEHSLDRGTFPCHLTVEYDDEGAAIEFGPEAARQQHCAGALIILMRQGRPSQMMRIAERLGWFDPDKLNLDAPVYRSFAAARAACRKATQRA